LSEAHTDVHDASQVLPSVFAAYQGEPETLDYGTRGQLEPGVSEQEKHVGSGGGL